MSADSAPSSAPVIKHVKGYEFIHEDVRWIHIPLDNVFLSEDLLCGKFIESDPKDFAIWPTSLPSIDCGLFMFIVNKKAFHSFFQLEKDFTGTYKRTVRSSTEVVEDRIHVRILSVNEEETMERRVSFLATRSGKFLSTFVVEYLVKAPGEKVDMAKFEVEEEEEMEIEEGKEEKVEKPEGEVHTAEAAMELKGKLDQKEKMPIRRSRRLVAEHAPSHLVEEEEPAIPAEDAEMDMKKADEQQEAFAIPAAEADNDVEVRLREKDKMGEQEEAGVPAEDAVSLKKRLEEKEKDHLAAQQAWEAEEDPFLQLPLLQQLHELSKELVELQGRYKATLGDI